MICVMKRFPSTQGFVSMRIKNQALAFIGLLLTISACSLRPSNNFRQQDLALMGMVRCLVTGGHMTYSEGVKFVAQIVKEQSGQFQNVYDAIHSGVSEDVNKKVEAYIKAGGGCRAILSNFTESEPETPFKKSIELDWILKPIKYFDEK